MPNYRNMARTIGRGVYNTARRAYTAYRGPATRAAQRYRRTVASRAYGAAATASVGAGSAALRKGYRYMSKSSKSKYKRPKTNRMKSGVNGVPPTFYKNYQKVVNNDKAMGVDMSFEKLLSIAVPRPNGTTPQRVAQSWRSFSHFESNELLLKTRELWPDGLEPDQLAILKKDKIHVVQWNIKYEFFNPSQFTCYVALYKVKTRNDTSITPGAQLTTALEAIDDTGDLEVTNEGITPYDLPLFNSFYAINGVKRFSIGPGKSHSVSDNLKNVTYDMNRIDHDVSYNKNCGHQWLMSLTWEKQVAPPGVTGAGDIGVTYGAIIPRVTKKIKVRCPNSIPDDLSISKLNSNAPTATGVNLTSDDLVKFNASNPYYRLNDAIMPPAGVYAPFA